MEDLKKRNKLKKFLDKSKEFLEKSKNNIFSTLSKTKEKIKNTINNISEKIRKVKKKTNDELTEILTQWADQRQHDNMQGQKEGIKQSKKEQENEEDEKEEEDKSYENKKDEQIIEGKIEQWLWNNLKELLNWYFSILEHLWEVDYLIDNIDYYNETLSELIKFSENTSMEETVWRVSDNGKFKEYCSAHLRNLLTPFKTIISLIEDLSTGIIKEDKFKSFINNLNTNFEDNKNDFLEFCEFLENMPWSRGTKKWDTNNEWEIDRDDNTIEIDFYEWDLDNDIKQAIIEQIIEKEKKKDYYAKWSEWIIFKIEIKDKNWEKKDYLVAKKRYDHNTHKEIDIHEKVQKLMPIWNDIVRVPKLKAEISRLDWENYIIMDFIKWKTIYQKMIEEILRKKWFWEFNFINDTEATNYFWKFLGIEKNTDENLNKLDQEYSHLSQWIKLFDSETWKKYAKSMEEFLNTMHNHWIYHRDIHPKNIIIWDDNKIYIIDFGKSIIVEPEKNNITKNEIYTEQVWEQTWKYPDDETWISIIKWLTKSEEDEENEERVKNHIKKEKELTKKINSWDSVVRYFSELPKWFKIKMERDQFIKQVEKEWKSSKRISLDTFLDSKWDELTVYLFAQSIENIENTLQEIEKQTKVCENKINKWNSDYRAEQPLFRKEYITPYEKKLKWMTTLKKKLERIKENIK